MYLHVYSHNHVHIYAEPNGTLAYIKGVFLPIIPIDMENSYIYTLKPDTCTYIAHVRLILTVTYSTKSGCTQLVFYLVAYLEYHETELHTTP